MRASSKGMRNAQNRVDGIGISGLANQSLAALLAPCGPEIAALQAPLSIFEPDFRIVFRIERIGSDQIHAECEVGSRFGLHIFAIAARQKAHESGIGGLQSDGDTANLNDDFVTLWRRWGVSSVASFYINSIDS